MINNDVETLKKIFTLIDSGIVDGYDSFSLEIEAFEGYMRETLTVEKGNTKKTDAEVNYNGAILLELVKELSNSFKSRGEAWCAFTMEYRHGGQVNTKFKYI